MDEFDGKVALVTGAGSGLGQEVSLALASLGVKVAVNDINPLQVDETVSQIRALGGTASAHVLDTAKRMPLQALVSQVLEQYAHLDILVNAAFVAPDEAILEMDEWEFHRTLDVNLGGSFFGMQLAGREMRQRGGGIILLLAWSQGNRVFRKGQAAYLASQAGLLSLTRPAADEFAPFGIRVHAVCLQTPAAELLSVHSLDRLTVQQWAQGYPNLRLGDHPNQVSLVLFLCSAEAASLNGQVVTVGEAG